MKERVPSDPADTRDLLATQERPLIRAAQALARRVAEFDPNSDYAPTRPQAVIVGGYVRDALLGLKPKDADIEVYGIAPDELRALLESMFGNVNAVGESFGILKVPVGNGLELDVSVPRRESKAGLGHAGFLIDSDPSLDIREAARRRDFTVNALALDPLTGVIFDPFGGIDDLRARVLRVTDPAKFEEDPLRVLRAMQFVARLEFSVDAESRRFMREMVERGDLSELSHERVTGELEKLLLKAKRPSLGLEFARSLGITERLFPELHATIGVPQEPEWHPEGDVWIHTLMVMDAAAKLIRQAERGLSEDERRQAMLGAMAHDFGKPSTTRVLDGRIRSMGHEEAGEEPTRQFFSRLTFGHKDVQAAVAVATQHLKPGVSFRALQKGELDEKSYVNAVRKVVKRLGDVSWRVLLASSEADFRGRTLPGVETDPYAPGLSFARTVLEHRLDQEARRDLIRGRDLIDVFGLTPGPRFRELIGRVEAARDAGDVETREQAIELVRALLENEKTQDTKTRSL